jgi:hypothetical protein
LDRRYSKRYQTNAKKSAKKEIVGGRWLALEVPPSLLEVWEHLQPEVEYLTALAGLRLLRGVVE